MPSGALASLLGGVRSSALMDMEQGYQQRNEAWKLARARRRRLEAPPPPPKLMQVKGADEMGNPKTFLVNPHTGEEVMAYGGEPEDDSGAWKMTSARVGGRTVKVLVNEKTGESRLVQRPGGGGPLDDKVEVKGNYVDRKGRRYSLVGGVRQYHDGPADGVLYKTLAQAPTANKKAVTDVEDKYKKDQTYVSAITGLDAARVIHDHLLTKNPTFFEGGKTLIVRMMGEKGAISEGDVSRISGDPSYKAAVKRLWHKRIEGEPTDQDVRDLRQVTGMIMKYQMSVAKGRIGVYVDDAYDAASGTVPKDVIHKRFAAKISKDPGYDVVKSAKAVEKRTGEQEERLRKAGVDRAGVKAARKARDEKSGRAAAQGGMLNIFRPRGQGPLKSHGRPQASVQGVLGAKTPEAQEKANEALLAELDRDPMEATLLPGSRVHMSDGTVIEYGEDGRALA